ncbi:hypothetical protein MBLNU459_g7075t1 [Dothideomycetes sp. NU459]
MEHDDDEETRSIFCLIVGAGMSGVTVGAHLLRLGVLRHDEFYLVDQNTDYGGVWETNRYPGAACDVPSHSYVMRWFLNPNWSKKYAPRPEIQEYYARIADHHGLRRNTLFSTKVISAHWNEDKLFWEVLTEDRVTAKRTRWLANAIVSAGGQFSRPKTAEIPGKESFSRTQWHTAEWRGDYDLTGKTVAIIGTGPSTGQVAPRIQPIVKQLYIYQRSSTFVLPRNDGPVPVWKKLFFKLFPPALWLYHIWFWLAIESTKRMWFSGTKENKAMYDYSMAFLERQVESPIVREKLRPRTQFGCKRVLILDDYYPIFNEPNVELITDKPIRITEKGIISKPADQVPQSEREKEPTGSYDLRNEAPHAVEEEREIDVLIWGTGFEMDNQGGHFQVYGIDGINLEETWGDRPQAYYSVGVSKFPNFMLMLGPNSANNWSNLTTIVEIQARYNCQLIRHLKENNKEGPYALYVDPLAQKDYNNWIQSNMGDVAILSSNCSNYYKACGFQF